METWSFHMGMFGLSALGIVGGPSRCAERGRERSVLTIGVEIEARSHVERQSHVTLCFCQMKTVLERGSEGQAIS